MPILYLTSYPMVKKMNMLKGCLSSKPLIRTKDLDVTIEHSAGFFWPHSMTVDKSPENFEATMDGVIQNEVTLLYTQYHAPVTINAGESGNFYLLQYNISGDGICRLGNRYTYTYPESMTILSPHMHSLMKYNDHVIQLCLKLNRSTIESYLENLIMNPVKEPVTFELGITGKTALPALVNALQYIVEQYRIDFPSRAYPEWDTAIAKMVIDLLLRLHVHNYSRKLFAGAGNCRPAYVRRAQEYIHEKSEELITLGELSMLTGVTSRTLHNAFRKYLDRTPMEYVRSVKLQKIHEELEKADADTKITDLVAKYSIYNFGRFAQRYKARYGCLPSETIKRHKSVLHHAIL